MDELMKGLVSKACALHKVRLDDDDPALVVVTLNRLMLEAVAGRVAEDVRAASVEFAASAERVQAAAGRAMAAEARRLMSASVVAAMPWWGWLLVAFLGGCLVGRWV